MPTLEGDVDRLKGFNAARIRAAHMRDKGLEALINSVDHPDPDEWTELEGVLEHAEVLKALLKQHARKEGDFERYTKLAKVLEKKEITIQAVMSEDPDPLPVLRAAKAMCALAAAPDSAFSEAVMYYLYCIVREIHSADPPDWSVGTARAGGNSRASIYVTWQCVRAITDFQIALRQTAQLIDAVATALKSNGEYLAKYDGAAAPSDAPPDAIQADWEACDSERLALSFMTTIASLRDNIALRLKDSLKLLDSKDSKGVLDFLGSIRSEIVGDIHRSKAEFSTAVKRIKEFRRVEFSKPNDIGRLSTESAHLLALATVREACGYTKSALECLESSDSAVEQLTKLAEEFRGAAGKFSYLLAPVREYVSLVLDRELASVMAKESSFGWDPAEMIFSAAAYGEAKQSWNDERIVRAIGHLISVIGPRGQVHTDRPMRITERGYQLYPASSEVLRALAWVLEHVEQPELEPSVANRMLAFFEDVQVPGTEGIFREFRGREIQNRRMTASAVLALSAINRMLDERINRTVYAHFSTKTTKDLKLSLKDLFYGDYGLRKYYHQEEEKLNASVVLEWMRAHVAGVASRVRKERAPFSLVLHGPPGTGKTQLVEALAHSCDVTLVEVTPSDIVIGGAEQIERRTRDVMFLLSLLTRTVILFDEFDPVLLRRNPEEKNPSVFSFLTPGMLPKLKNLYERARERSTAYVLITNLIGKLDDAAIREGRFDKHLGIYPPDLLSRYGRLRSEVKKYEKTVDHLPQHDDHEKRFWEVVRKSWGGSMTTLGRRGWFTAPGEKPEYRTAFAYLYGLDDQPPKPPREATPERLTFVPSHLDTWPGDGEGETVGEAEKHAIAEYREWAWVHKWDQQFQNREEKPEEWPAGGASKDELDISYEKAIVKLRDRLRTPIRVLCRMDETQPPAAG